MLLAPILVLGGKEKKVDSRIRELEIKVKTLEEQSKQLKIEGIKNEAATSSATNVKSTGTQPVQRIRSANFSGGCEQYRGLVSQYAWNTDIALAVMYAESGCRSDALSRTGDRGLMQINWVHSAKVGGDLNKLFDPATNVAVAYQIYSASGWTPWSVCKNGTVKCY